MLQLDRFTTEYVESEDRIRLRAQSLQGEVLVLWLTQRLLGRLVAYGCNWLEAQNPGSEVVQSLQHSWAQQAARQALQQDPQPPVELPPAGAASTVRSVLVCSVDITHVQGQLILCWKDADGVAQAQLGLPVQALRQWLSILQAQYRKAEWPLQHWPQWLQDSAEVPSPGSRSAHMLH